MSAASASLLVLAALTALAAIAAHQSAEAAVIDGYPLANLFARTNEIRKKSTDLAVSILVNELINQCL